MVTELLGRSKVKVACVGLVFVGLACLGEWAEADPGLVTQSGLPVTVKPTASEPGLPQFTYPTGVPSGTGTGIGGDGSGTTGSGSGATGSGGSASNLPPNATLDQVAQQDYIQTAAAAAGVTPAALAATCLAESNCQNVGAANGSTASGEFQMINSTYTAMINEFAANNPDIPVDTSLAGKMDPTNEAYAAAQYLADGVSALQSDGDANPTNSDLRAYYQFGGATGPSVALAPDSANLEGLVNLTPSQMAANGITATTTVGQWRATYANQVGAVANQAVGI
jgi:hypothetical protein